MAGGQGELRTLRPEEFVAKCSIYPRAPAPDGAFAHEALLDLGKMCEAKSPPYALSCACRTVLPLLIDVHSFGCRLAIKKNNRKASREGRPLLRPEETFHYVGFYDLLVRQIVDISISAYSIRVALHPEDGEDAHCNIVLEPVPEATKAMLKTARTEFLAQICALLRGPIRHVCTNDIDVSAFLQGQCLPSFSEEPVSQ